MYCIAKGQSLLLLVHNQIKHYFEHAYCYIIPAYSVMAQFENVLHTGRDMYGCTIHFTLEAR